MFLILISELIDSFGAILEAPKVFESGISTADDIGSHDVGSDREIEATEATGHSHAHKAGLAASVEIAGSTLGIDHTVIFHAGSCMVDLLGIFSDDIAAYFAYDFEHLVIAILGVGIVEGGIIVFFGISVIAFLERHDLLHHRMGEIMFERLVVFIEISHYFVFFL